VMGWASPEIDDGMLLANIAQSDVGALQALYDRYASPVYSLAQGLLQDPEAAQQVTWETFLAIWRDAPIFDAERGNPRAWILALAHERSVELSRHRRSEDGGVVPETATHDAGVVAYAMRTIHSAHVQKALEALPSQQRTVLVLAYYGGYTQREISERTGAPLEAVRIWVRDGLLHLYTLLQEERRRCAL
jgi:RNA polymerase sigma-70 factor, ECF subfamily